MSNTYHHHHRRMRWNGPNWWTHMFGTKPIRAKTKMILRNVRRHVEIDNVMLPHQKHNKRGYYY